MKHRLFAVLAFFFVGQAAAADPLLDMFPYPLLSVKGTDAFEEWQALRSGEGTPIILGSREEVERILSGFDPSYDAYYEPLDDAISSAETHRHPDALYAHRVAEHAYLVERLKEDGSDWAEELEQIDPLAVPDDYWGTGRTRLRKPIG